MVLFARREKGNDEQKRMQVGKYELGRTLGEGNFGKVKHAKSLDSGHSFAVKILDKSRIVDRRITDQIKREIGTLKLLRHPNVVRLHEVIASKSKVYMVLEYVDGGELFDQIASKGKLSEAAGRKMFQQLVDGVSYCHNKGVFHRDLKLENVLVDGEGNIKISDFGLGALPQHFRDDGLLHTTCGSPNYVAPEVLHNRGYDGATSDTWSCGVILYVILTGYLPFDDRNLAVLYQKIFKGDVHFPKRLSAGARNLIRRILDPDPRTRITMAEIKEDQWFKRKYTPADPDEDEEDTCIDDEALTINESPLAEKDPDSPTLINAFQLIGMSSSLDLSGFFEKEDVSERKIRFTSRHSQRELIERIEDIVIQMGFGVKKSSGKGDITDLAVSSIRFWWLLLQMTSAFEFGAYQMGFLYVFCGDTRQLLLLLHSAPYLILSTSYYRRPMMGAAVSGMPSPLTLHHAYICQSEQMMLQVKAMHPPQVPVPPQVLCT